MLNAWFPDNRLNSVFGMINTATYSGGLGGTALAAAMQVLQSHYSPTKYRVFPNVHISSHRSTLAGGLCSLSRP